MDIYWYGHACFKIKGKNASVLIDPYDPEMMGLKLPKDMSADVALITHGHPDHNNIAPVTGHALTITGPGEYEVKGITVTGVTVSHDKKNGEERGKNTVYNIGIDGLNIVHLGDLGETLSESQIEEIGLTDILLIPVGGTFTIDAKDAVNVISSLEPKVIIPMHYGVEGLKFELEPVSTFLKEMGTENIEPLPKYSVTKDKLPEETQVILLNKV